MRTPFRLAATLAKFRLTQALTSTKKLPLRRFELPNEAAETFVPQRAAAAYDSGTADVSSPICWLTGRPDALSNLSIGKITRELQDGGRTIFLATDAALLRRRIHEFHPSAGLYFAIELYGPPHLHDRRVRREGAFAQAMEGIRAAQLSGFLVCAHVIVEPGTQLHEVSQLLEHLGTMNLDGVLITAQNEAEKTQRETAMVGRTLIGNRWWSSFSRLVQLSFDEQGGRVASESARTADVESSVMSEAVAAGAHDTILPEAGRSEEVSVQ